jgi:hypothetical protein
VLFRSLLVVVFTSRLNIVWYLRLSRQRYEGVVMPSGFETARRASDQHKWKTVCFKQFLSFKIILLDFMKQQCFGNWVCFHPLSLDPLFETYCQDLCV